MYTQTHTNKYLYYLNLMFIQHTQLYKNLIVMNAISYSLEKNLYHSSVFIDIL